MQKIAAVPAAALAVLGVLAVATPGFAQGYGGYAYEACQAKKSNHGVTGALIGGAAGAVLGSQIAGRGDRTEGSVIGGLAGAFLGNTVGRANAKQSAACEARDYGRSAYRRTYYDGRYEPYGYRDYRYGGYRY